MSFSIVVAHDNNRGIGNNGSIQWGKIHDDMKRFVFLTSSVTMGKQNAVVMGRKTYESLHRPLKNRLNVVLTRNADQTVTEDVVTYNSFDVAITELTSESSIENVFVIGGEEIYKLALNDNRCDKIYVTEIDIDCVADRYFPEIPSHFVTCGKIILEPKENQPRLTFKTYAKV